MNPGSERPATPFLKWAGGKTQLLPTFRRFYPSALKNGRLRRYVEPFLGSGAVFLDVVQRYPIESALLADVNPELILTWRVVQRDVHKLIEALEPYARGYRSRNAEQRKAFYYATREAFNRGRARMDHDRYAANWVERAAQLIFLNKTCYNGLFRLNARGEFNVPAGDYRNPTIFDPDNLIRVAGLLQKAEVRRLPFVELPRRVPPGAFVYLDPPYRPLTRTANFTAYSAIPFGDAEQRRLAEAYRALHRRGCKLMLSNSDPRNADPTDAFFDELYAGFHVFRVRANRMINSDKRKRGPISEILVLNYEVAPPAHRLNEKSDGASHRLEPMPHRRCS